MDEREPVFDRGFYFGEWLVGVVVGLRVGQTLVLEVVGSGVGVCPSGEGVGVAGVGFRCVSVGLCSPGDA
jgi:hypothetical protein